MAGRHSLQEWRRRLAHGRGWLTLCVVSLVILLPAQGVALSMDQALRPAHYHLSSLQSSSPLNFSETVAPADEQVLAFLTPSAFREARAVRAVAEKVTAASTATRHVSVGYHSHPLDDPDVVYVDDFGRPGKSLSGVEKPSSDGMVMLFPSWPALLPGRAASICLASTPTLECGGRMEPPDRPPAS